MRPQRLPKVSEFVANYVAQELYNREVMQRTPINTAKVLVFAVLMHRTTETRRAWPIRQEVADHLGVSKALLDMVISQRSATGHLELNIVSEPGSVADRPSIIKVRYVKPSQELTRWVEDAEALERDAKRRRRPRAAASVLVPFLIAAFTAGCHICAGCPWTIPCHIVS